MTIPPTTNLKWPSQKSITTNVKSSQVTEREEKMETTTLPPFNATAKANILHQLYYRSMGKIFRVRAICHTDDQAIRIAGL